MQLSFSHAIAIWLTSVAVTTAPCKAAPPSDHGLSGLWSNATRTPLERPPGFGAPVMSPAEARAFEKTRSEAFLTNSDGVDGHASEWAPLDGPMIEVDGAIHSSIIVEPPDGKLPYSEQGRRRLEAVQAASRENFDGPESRPPMERCLTGASGAGGSPIFPHFYNTNYLIVETKAAVAIWAETGGSVRIVRLSGSHPPTSVRMWTGDSIGRWEGRTLVVETANFKPGDSTKQPLAVIISPEAKVTERFTRVADDRILYEFTVDDPATYSRAWKGEEIFHRTRGPILEFACHEGNYALGNILLGARAGAGSRPR